MFKDCSTDYSPNISSQTSSSSSRGKIKFIPAMLSLFLASIILGSTAQAYDCETYLKEKKLSLGNLDVSEELNEDYLNQYRNQIDDFYRNYFETSWLTQRKSEGLKRILTQAGIIPTMIAQPQYSYGSGFIIGPVFKGRRNDTNYLLLCLNVSLSGSDRNFSDVKYDLENNLDSDQVTLKRNISGSAEGWEAFYVRLGSNSPSTNELKNLIFFNTQAEVKLEINSSALSDNTQASASGPQQIKLHDELSGYVHKHGAFSKDEQISYPPTINRNSGILDMGVIFDKWQHVHDMSVLIKAPQSLVYPAGYIGFTTRGCYSGPLLDQGRGIVYAQDYLGLVIKPIETKVSKLLGFQYSLSSSMLGAYPSGFAFKNLDNTCSAQASPGSDIVAQHELTFGRFHFSGVDQRSDLLHDLQYYSLSTADKNATSTNTSRIAEYEYRTVTSQGKTMPYVWSATGKSRQDDLMFDWTFSGIAQKGRNDDYAFLPQRFTTTLRNPSSTLMSSVFEWGEVKRVSPDLFGRDAAPFLKDYEPVSITIEKEGYEPLSWNIDSGPTDGSGRKRSFLLAYPPTDIFPMQAKTIIQEFSDSNSMSKLMGLGLAPDRMEEGYQRDTNGR